MLKNLPLSFFNLLKMSSQNSDSDIEFLTAAVDAMDQEEEEDRFLLDAINAMDHEEKEEDHFHSAGAGAGAAVPHLQDDDQLLLIPAVADPDEMASPDYDAPPTPQQVGENPDQILTFSAIEMTLTTAWVIFVQGML